LCVLVGQIKNLTKLKCLSAIVLVNVEAISTVFND